ncbi:hypothetical protein [Xanthobacter sediminis]
MLWGAPSASAHRRADPQAVAARGLGIPNLTHGQMAVMDAFAPAVRALASDGGRTDEIFRRLANFAALQRTYCLWLALPGSVADEASPFNECAHAYLAALRALLLHMQDMPERRPAAQALAAEIEGEMIRHAASLNLCRSSAEDFNTAEVIMPEWREIPAHGPSLLTLAGMALLAAGALGAGAMALRRG